MNIKKIVLEKLEKFAKDFPEFQDELSRVAEAFGADSQEGRRHTIGEHWIMREVSSIILAVKNGDDLSKELRYLIEEYWERARFSRITEKDQKLLDGFYECIKDLATTLGIQYKIPTNERNEAQDQGRK